MNDYNFFYINVNRGLLLFLFNPLIFKMQKKKKQSMNRILKQCWSTIP